MSRAILNRESPYLAEHHRSKAQRMEPPRDLLGWFVRGFRAEMPDEVHAGGVWRDWKPLTENSDRRPVGGSLLGSPRYDDGFRRFIEDGADALEVAEYEGHRDRAAHYRFPIRAALASLAGRGKDTDPFPFMARFLYRIVLRDGDWDAAGASLGIMVIVADADGHRVVSEALSRDLRMRYRDEALGRLWGRYATEPREVDAA